MSNEQARASQRLGTPWSLPRYLATWLTWLDGAMQHSLAFGRLRFEGAGPEAEFTWASCTFILDEALDFGFGVKHVSAMALGFLVVTFTVQ